ncbi:alpha-ketoacid dehydrogenase subunit beta [Candidatus Pelagibacter sp. HIMB1623]|uniref:alpha-ketoacid dehydrogenase subunit beta n=1 Tax=Candidatus Pelagibacter sp. HIMB1623 TaxID=3413358 RepID=UPI003F880155
MKTKKYNYGTAILAAFEYLLKNYKETFVIGQGLWSPWYVGNSMTDLDKKFGKNRIIDTPVSESAVTGAAIGASLAGMKPIVVHPRMDFMLYSMDAIVNQAAKWSHMFGGQANPEVTIRGIINRGGEQGAQHSQALHSWFAHVPGLRVVMPSTVADARDLLIASVLCKDPVIYIDDRWLYEQEENLPKIIELDLKTQKPKITSKGKDVTIIASGYSSYLARQAKERLRKVNINPEIIDVRVLNPLYIKDIVKSVTKTRKLVVIDPGWVSSGFSAELVAKVVENLDAQTLKSQPLRIALPDAPAPTATILEKKYYTSVEDVYKKVKNLVLK